MARWTFTPNCVTSDGTTFYGHEVYTFTSGRDERTIVIAKSNSNPASFNDVTWTIVATANEADLGYLSGMNIMKTILCNVDKQGVFTIIASTTKKSPSDAENFPQGGYQYTPNADGSSGGSWSKITMTEPYPWSGIGRASLTNIPGLNGGKDVVAHVFSHSNIEDTVSVAILDPVSKSFAIKSNWTLSSPSNVNYLVSTDGKKNSAVVKTAYAKDYKDLYPIGPPGGEAVWAMMTNFSDYSGVVLSGANAGMFQSIPKKMTLDGLPGNGDIWDDKTGSGGGGDGGGIGNLSTGAIAGIIAGVLICIVSSSSMCRILSKRGKNYLAYSRPTTPVPEDPDAFVPNIDEVPEAKMECDILSMAPNAPAALSSGTGAGVSPGKGQATSSMLPLPTFAPRSPLDTTLSQVAAPPQPSLSPSSTQNTFEDGYQQGFQQALLALRNEQKQQQQQQQQDQQRQTQNPHSVTNTLPLDPQAITSALPPTNFSNTATTSVLSTAVTNHPQLYAQSNDPQHYAQPNSPQYYGQQQSVGYYQTGATQDSFRNPQDYSVGIPQSSPATPRSTLASPLPAYNSGSVTMSPAPSYATGPSSGIGTPYTQSSRISTQVWAPDLTSSGTASVYQQNHRPGNQGPNPSYHQ
ncbi:hypothetical protein EC991_002748 [Linnemannia zychae]|nr:hypothetical protein EC991_002748 [Linnemannia zychae]